MRALKALASLCRCVGSIEHCVAHTCESIKKIACAGPFHIAGTFCLLDASSGKRFEFGSGRFLAYTCLGVKMYYLGIKILRYEQI